MDFLHRWEKRFGRRAVPHLTRYIIMTYIAGYVLMLIGSATHNYDVIRSLLMLSPAGILKGQVWRLFTWLLIPPSDIGIFTLIMLFVYYQLGSLLEKMWGDFLYNVYIFTGLIMTVIGAFLLYAATGNDYGVMFSTYYVSLSIFLGFAMTFPEQQMLFMFFIPIKIKYLAIVDIAYLIYEIVQYSRYGLGLPVLVMILCSLTGTILFFFGTRKNGKIRFRGTVQSSFRRQRTKPAGPAAGNKVDRTTFAGPQGKIAIHRCAVCGRTELDDPNLEFRFCSQCNGNYEYCSDHLRNHIHVK